MSLESIEAVDKFYVEQTFTPLINRYKISTVAPDGEHPGDQLLAFVEQKRLKIREEINIFADESQTQHLMQIKARKVFEFRGRSDLFLANGTRLAQFQKQFTESLLRSTWQILDNNDNVRATSQERSMAMAVLRRVWGWIPYLGDIPFFIPFHFEILIDGKVVGVYTRIFGRLRDSYVMDLTMDTDRKLDRRVAVAFAIALDALQDR